jgi:diguanylate cyclase (GGDEF)-like protein
MHLSALEPSRALTDARLSVWTSEAGLPQSTIHTIVQTRDGYLWMGTEEGLVRFDGVRFVVQDRQNTPALRSSFVSSLYEAPDGTLWIGSYGGGLAQLRNGKVEGFRPDILGSDRIREMQATADGTLFVATAGGGLLRVSGRNVTRITTREGLPTDRIWALEDDGQGGLWIATHGFGVIRWNQGSVKQRITALPNGFTRALLRDPDGTLWIGTDGGGLALWRKGAVVRVITTRDGLPSDFVRTLRRDRDGSLWIGTDGGLARIHGAPAALGHRNAANEIDGRGLEIETLGDADGLPRPSILSLAEDREGNIWIGTTGGLVRLRDTRVRALTQREGLPPGTIRAVLEDSTGRVWVGSEGGGLCRVTPAPTQCFTRKEGLPHDNVYALAESADGSLWVGTDGGGVVRFRDGRLSDAIDARSGLPNDRVRALVETPDGSLWISTTAGLARRAGGRLTRVPELEDRQLRPLLAMRDGTLLVGTDGAGLWTVTADGTRAAPVANAGHGLENDRVFSLAPDPTGSGVWIGTSGGGLARLDLTTGTTRSITRRNGLYDDVVFQVVDGGPHADLWLTSNRGVYRVSRDRVLEAMASGSSTSLRGSVYGVADGMPSAECVGASPAAIRARDGHIWVATTQGVAVIDPAARTRNTVPPPVHVEEVLVDGNPVPAGAPRIPAGAQRLEIRYTALSLRAPDRVTFRYFLEGYDQSWVDAGTTRVAHYTRLAPGRYTFRVVATNEDGVASSGEARLPMTVAPQWYETWWARLLAVVLAAAILWGIVRLRIAAELEDTNRQLAIANERLRALSYVDGLTGVANRRHFDEALEEACRASRADNKPLSLVLMDLDHFKDLNDSHGHQSGDEALKSVAALLAERTAARGGLAARFGGEEFAWLLPGVGLEAAKAEAEALRLRVREAGIPHKGASAGIVTASFGVASTAAAPLPLALVAAADAALYRAKSAGRDRVESEPLG